MSTSQILQIVESGIFVTILSTAISETHNQRREQKELVALIKTLRTECQGNSRHRISIQTYWLEKALLNISFHEQCKDLSDIAAQTLQFAIDNNNGTLKRHNMEPADVQELMIDISEKIDKILPTLQARTSLLGYLWWKKRFIINLIIAGLISYCIYSYSDYAISFWENIK